jgi:hypothetical protein
MLKVFSKDKEESVAEESPKEEPASASSEPAQSEEPEKAE